MTGLREDEREYERALLAHVLGNVPASRETPDFMHALATALIATRPLLAARAAQTDATVALDGTELIRALTDAWDCCATCAGGVLARYARKVAAQTDARYAIADALDRIADDWADRWVKDGRHHGMPGCYSDGYERDLRGRAGAIRSMLHVTDQPALTEDQP